MYTYYTLIIVLTYTEIDATVTLPSSSNFLATLSTIINYSNSFGPRIIKTLRYSVSYELCTDCPAGIGWKCLRSAVHLCEQSLRVVFILDNFVIPSHSQIALS